MCGISGFTFADADLVEAMNASQAHRGPDHGGRYVDERVSLGHRRLSILDLSAAAHQPMSDSAERIWLTYNGEIYNFRELRAELEATGASFRSHSDSEVLVHGWRRWGTKLFARLNGMFALGLYDRDRGQLVLARDPWGIKPLYYHAGNGRLLFASEMKALLCHDLPREIDREALAEFLTYRFALGPRTLLAGVRKLEPGRFLVWDLRAGRVAESGRFWAPPSDEPDGDDLDGLARRLRELVIEAVRVRLVSDVPLGFFLSGGLDSTVVVAAARELGAEVKGFSAGFATTNELPFARIAADRFAHSLREVAIGDDSLELLDAVVEHADEPVGDAAFLAVYVLSREASREVKVVLAGEGADELLGGYDRYKALLYGGWLGRALPGAPVAALGARMRGENLRRALAILAARDPLSRYQEIVRLFSPRELRELGVEEAHGLEGRVEPELFDRDPLRAAQILDLATLLPDDFFVKADKMTSAWGLEMRVPFLDPHVVDFCLRLPWRAKLRGWNEKYLLKRAFAGRLPEAIVRRRKHGFNVPMDAWLRGRAGERLERMLGERVHDCYDPRPALELLARYRAAPGRSYKAEFHDAQKLWSLLVFEIWVRRFATP